MPRCPKDQTFYSKADAYVFYGVSVGGWLMRWLFLIGIILGLGRMVFIGVLAFSQYLRSRRRELDHFGEQYQPLVSVVVPAYNEGKVIVRTIESLLASDYQNFEIIDRRSTDRRTETFEVAQTEVFGNIDNRSFSRKAERRQSRGSQFRLAKGMRRDHHRSRRRHAIYAADYLLLSLIALPIRAIGAVAGNAKVGNRINIVTKWQALEYVTSQNFDRRAFASLNCIIVVPGSVGAWRRSVLEEAGGFSSDTLAEDQDLTIQVRKLGYRIGYEEAAIGLTEAPDSLRNLAKQRFRWSFGTLQCMWKHKNALLNPRYGTLGADRDAECLDLSGPLPADLAGDGPDVRLDHCGSTDYVA